jgi:hypothetical protein
MNRIIGVNYLSCITDQREVVRPYLYSKMPSFQTNGILTYARIYKNAHQSLKTFFHALNFNTEYIHPKQIKSNEKIIVVLRDPLERWISGLTQYFIERVPNLAMQFGNDENLNITQDIIKLCIDNSVMDLHTETQVSFLHGIKFDQCVFFKLDENIEINLCNFLQGALRQNIDIKLPSINQSKNNNKKIEIQQSINKFLNNNNSEKNNLLKALDRDYKLLEDVEKTKGFFSGTN